MKKLIYLSLAFISFPLCSQGQSHTPEIDFDTMVIRDRRAPYTPYENYRLSLSSALRAATQYRKHFDEKKLDPNNENAYAMYRGKLRLEFLSLLKDRDAFIHHASQDESLTPEQAAIVKQIQELSFPLLKEKSFDDLTTEELVQSINHESLQIEPLVKAFTK